MALIAMENPGQAGIVKDIAPWQLPPNVWSDGNNVRTEEGAIRKIPGYSSIMETVPIAPYHVVFLQAGSSKYWIAAGLTAVHVHNGTSWSNITRSSGAYNATATENWSSTVLGGILILANANDDPQFWNLTSGLPSTSTLLADLTNWPANTTCASMQSFRSFLFALDVTESSVNYPDKVRWSSEAATQTVPGTWSESDATQDAGSYHLADTPGKIIQGLPLRDTFFIYKEDAVYSASFVGTPYIWAFKQVSPTVGALAKGCVVEYSGGHAIFGRGNFYINDGQRIQAILPHKMRDHVFSTIDGEHYEKSFVVADYARNEILFCYVSTDSTSNFVDKSCIWNYVENTFSLRDLPQLAHIGYGIAEDETALTTWSAATPTWSSAIGAWAMSWDKVENVLVFASPTDTKIYRDNVGNQEDGSNMTSYLERTGLTTTAAGSPDQSTVKQIKAVWPKMEIDNSSEINVYVGSQMSTEEAITWKGPYAFNPDTQSKVSCRISGKLYGIKFESTSDMNWKLNGVEIEVVDAGRRGSRSY